MLYIKSIRGLLFLLLLDCSFMKKQITHIHIELQLLILIIWYTD